MTVPERPTPESIAAAKRAQRAERAAAGIVVDDDGRILRIDDVIERAVQRAWQRWMRREPFFCGSPSPSVSQADTDECSGKG